MSYASWSDPKSVDQLLALENDPAPGDLVALLDEVIAAALEGVAETADAKTRMLHLIWYIHTHFVAGTPEPSYTTRRALEQRVAECGGSSLILQLAARRLGFATRGVGFFGVPIQAAHTAVEVYWDDAWHYLDPSFGAFFTHDGTLDGEIVDVATLARHRDVASANAFYPVADGRLGRSYTSPKPDTLAKMFGKKQIDLPWSGDYTLFLPHAVAASAYSTEALLETSYAVSLTEGTYEIGGVDDSGADIAMHVGPAGYLDGASLSFVGDASSSHGVLFSEITFNLTGLAPRKRVRWQAVTLTDNVEQLDVEVRKGRVLELSRSGKRLTLRVEAVRDNVEVHLTTRRSERIRFDAHRFETE